MPGKIGLGKIVLLVSAAAGAALFGAWILPSTPASVPEERLPSSAEQKTVSPDTDEVRFYLPQSGYRYTYAFRRNIAFNGNMGGATIPPVGFAGDFYIDVLRADSRSFEAVVSEKIQGAPAPRSPLIRVESDARGDQLHVFTLSGLGELEKQHAGIVKDLVALWLFPLRSDTVGEYEARFDPLVAEKGFAREKKSKLSYFSKAPNTPTILTSEHYLLWNFSTHLPDEVKGLETTRLGRGDSALVAESRYEMRFRNRERSPAMSSALLTALSERDALAFDTSHPNMAEHPDYANLDWGKLMNDLKVVDKLTGMQRLNLFGDMLKFLRLHPERATDLFSLLRDPSLLALGAASPEFRTIVGALANFASPEALAALREAFIDPALAAPGKGMILAALTTTQAPIDSATRDFLVQQSQNADARLAQATAFALGSSLQNAPNDEQSSRAVQLIEQNFAQASGVTAQNNAIDVMGNSGRADFLPALESVVQGNYDAAVKARAVFALRFIKAPAAVQDLITALSSKDPAQRESAAGAIAIADWSESFRAPLTQCSSSETLSRIQTSCQKTLSNNTQVASK
ncbi:MAG: HEAT repeat domain-containing protein [Bdellovibrionota bacterium]